jgi:hypothetical protein
MKLPGYTPRGVERLQGVNPGVYDRLGQAYQQVGVAVSDAALKVQEAVVERQGRQAILDLSNNLTAFRAEYGDKRDFTEDELKDLGVKLSEKERWQETVDSSGKRVRVRRETYAAEDYYPQALKRQWEAQAQLAASTLTGPGRREEFLARQQELINQAYVSEIERAQAKREARRKVQYEVDIQKARTAGDYTMAAELIRQHPDYSPEVKEQELVRNWSAEEQALLFRIREQADLATIPNIDQQIERLQSPTYGQEEGRFNSMTVDEREAEIKALKATKAALIKDAEVAQDTQLGADWAEFYAAASDPEVPRQALVQQLDVLVKRHGLKRADVAAAYSLIDNAGKEYDGGVTYDNTYAELLQQAISDPGKFAEVRLGALRPRLRQEDYNDLVKRQREIKSGSTKVQSLNDMSTAALLALGIDIRPTADKPGERESRIVSTYQRTLRTILQTREKAKGAPLDEVELQKAVDDALMVSTMNRKGEVGGITVGGVTLPFGARPLFEQGVPQAFIDQAIKEYAEVGQSPDAETIAKTWRKLTKQQQKRFLDGQ